MSAGLSRILVVDDEPIVAHTVHRFLRRQNSVSVETDGPKALAMLDRETFDLVICDLMMSPLTGMEVYRRATQANPRLVNRFLLMTGGVFRTEVVQFLDHWPYLLLLKPFNLTEATSLVEASLARADGSSR